MNVFARTAKFFTLLITSTVVSGGSLAVAADCPPLVIPTRFSTEPVADFAAEMLAPLNRSATEPNADSDSGEPQRAVEEPDAPVATSVAFALQRGPLRPQLEQLLRQHLAVQQVVWQAPTDIQWPSQYSLQGDNWLALVEQLAGSYRLQISLFANHIAVVQAQGEVGL